MDHYLTEILGQMPPVPPGSAETYFSDRMVVFRPNMVFSTECGFDGYQFLMPLCRFPKIRVEKRLYMIEPDSAFPINPWQEHAAIARMLVQPYITVFLNPQMVNSLAKSVLGKRDVYYQNASLALTPDIHHLVGLFMTEFAHRQSGFRFIMDSLTVQITVNLLRLYADDGQVQTRRHCSDKKGVREVIAFLNDNYRYEFSLEEIAQIVNYSPYHLIRVFKSETGKTPFEYLLGIKIDRAKGLLKYSDCSIAEVCYRCGFNNPTHFTAVFKRKVGVSPSVYRKQVKT